MVNVHFVTPRCNVGKVPLTESPLAWLHLMATRFLDLPHEIRLKVYERVLWDTPISLVLRTKFDSINVVPNSGGRVIGFAYNPAFPTQETLKAQLVEQKSVLSLLFVCKQIKLDLEPTFYNNLRLHIRLDQRGDRQRPNWWVKAAGRDVLHPLLMGNACGNLTERVACISMPFDAAGEWKEMEYFVDLPKLKEVIFYDQPKSMSHAAKSASDMVTKWQEKLQAFDRYLAAYPDHRERAEDFDNAYQLKLQGWVDENKVCIATIDSSSGATTFEEKPVSEAAVKPDELPSRTLWEHAKEVAKEKRSAGES